jgi:hypothetical protein
VVVSKDALSAEWQSSRYLAFWLRHGLEITYPDTPLADDDLWNKKSRRAGELRNGLLATAIVRVERDERCIR